MGPWMGGGDMVETVTLQKTTYAPLPLKFEAGTPNFIGAAALGDALQFVSSLDKEFAHKHEDRLTELLMNGLRNIEGLKIYGDAPGKIPLASFTIEGVHHADLAMLLDKMGIAVRSGMMCCEPLMTRFGVTGMVRVSLTVYNTEEEIEILIKSLMRAVNMLKQ